MNELVHKRKPFTTGGGPPTMCGQYGYHTVLWRKVNCEVCLRQRKGTK